MPDKQDMPKKSDYIIGIMASPFLGFCFFFLWLFYNIWTKNNYIILQNDKRVKVGSWRWWWYRLVLTYSTAKRCPDCRKIIDSIHTVNLCECAYKLDMKGMK